MPSQSWRQLSALQAPANQDTTCRVRRQSATQTQQALALHWTNDHSSSSSSTSSGWAGANVVSKGGNSQVFFLCPLGINHADTVWRATPKVRSRPQAGALVVRPQNFGFPFFTVTIIGVQCAVATACVAADNCFPVLVFPIRVRWLLSQRGQV